jgi:hypothetical protein
MPPSRYLKREDTNRVVAEKLLRYLKPTAQEQMTEAYESRDPDVVPRIPVNSPMRGSPFAKDCMGLIATREFEANQVPPEDSDEEGEGIRGEPGSS